MYDILGWCSPIVVKLNVMLLRIWEEKLEWDELYLLFVPKYGKGDKARYILYRTTLSHTAT